MILLAGQIPRHFRHREAFQEVDARAVFGTMAKWVVEIDDPARTPEFIARAVRVATQGRPGPVVITLPEDMLVEEAAADDIAAFEPVEISPALSDMARLQKLLAAAERPLVIAGGSRWNEKAVASLVRFAERFDIPVAASFRRQMLFPEPARLLCRRSRHRAQPEAHRARKERRSRARIRRAFLGMAEPGLYAARRHPIPASRSCTCMPGSKSWAAFISRRSPSTRHPSPSPPRSKGWRRRRKIRWREWRKSARADYLAWSEEVPKHPGAAQMGTIVRWLREHLPADSILCNGAGNFSIWLHRFYRYPQFGTQLAPLSGSMGYGVPGRGRRQAHPSRAHRAWRFPATAIS